MHWYGVRGRNPDASEFMEIRVEKSMETMIFLKNFMNSERIFLLNTPILIKKYGTPDGLMKIFNNSKRI